MAAASSSDSWKRKNSSSAREVESEARGRGPFDLALQDAAGRHLDRRSFLVEQVAQHERGLLEPRDAADGREVGLGGHVAVTLGPVRERVPRQHVHLAVDGKQVVARVQRLGAALHVVDPVGAGDPLADEAALQVGERDEDRVDLAGADRLSEQRSVQHPARGHAGSLFTRA